jgi:hypothetical protein
MSKVASKLGHHLYGVRRVHSVRRIVLAASIVGMALLGGSQASAAAAPVNPAPAHQGVVSTPNIQYPCTPYARGDYVHISSTAPLAASGHGWWLNNDCNESYGYVTVTLEEYLSGSWHNKAYNSGSVPPGGGSGARVTARVNCNSATSTTWRSYVTVNVSGPLGYGSNAEYTPNQTIGCRV